MMAKNGDLVESLQKSPTKNTSKVNFGNKRPKLRRLDLLTGVITPFITGWG